MKLKKIASLMLAGIMAVSMLTACGGKTTGNEEEKPPVVDPVDTSFAASVNELLSDEQKAVLTFENDATLNSVLAKVAPTIDSKNLHPIFNLGGELVYSVDAMDMRHLLGIDRTNSMVGYDHLFHADATSVTTAADIFVVDGNYTEEGVAEFVAHFVGNAINGHRLPALSDKNIGRRYSYTGSIACTKVTNLSGDFESYVVAFTVTQTPTKISNNNNCSEPVKSAK